MSPLEDFLIRLIGALIFAALVASVMADRRRADRPAPVHDARRCLACVALRHPANRDARQALSVFPRQDRGGDL